MRWPICPGVSIASRQAWAAWIPTTDEDMIGIIGALDSNRRQEVLKVNPVRSSIALGLCISIAAFAQFDLASVVGTVKDPTGLPIPQVTVEIRSVATNITRN